MLTQNLLKSADTVGNHALNFL